MVVHLITDDIYIDIKFLSWSGGGSGGGFSYERSTNQNLSTNEFTLSNTIKLSPNPASNYITVSGLAETKNYAIYNILGVTIKSGTISNKKQINVSNFSDGVYVLKFEGGNTFKFVKK